MPALGRERASDFASEPAFDVRQLDIGVLDHVVEQGGDDGGAVEAEITEDLGDGEGVGVQPEPGHVTRAMYEEVQALMGRMEEVLAHLVAEDGKEVVRAPPLFDVEQAREAWKRLYPARPDPAFDMGLDEALRQESLATAGEDSGIDEPMPEPPEEP